MSRFPALVRAHQELQDYTKHKTVKPHVTWNTMPIDQIISSNHYYDLRTPSEVNPANHTTPPFTHRSKTGCTPKLKLKSSNSLIESNHTSKLF